MANGQMAKWPDPFQKMPLLTELEILFGLVFYRDVAPTALGFYGGIGSLGLQPKLSH
jgi:hypothetical protein